MLDERVRRYFDGVAATYARTWTDVALGYPLVQRRSEHALRWLRGRMHPGSGWVLDIGCGTGYFLDLLANAGYRAHGLDVAPRMVEEARQRVAARGAGPDRVVVEVADAAAWNPPRRFQGAVALGVLEYLPEDEEVFRTVNGALEPGGGFLVECRNRLFSLCSANHYTRDAIRSGEHERLLHEYEELQRTPLLRPFRDAAGEAVEALRAALEARGAPEKPGTRHGEAAPGEGPEPETLARRQHTPLQLAAVADRHGFEMVHLHFLHFHPFPPRFEAEAPIIFRRLGLALDTLGDTPIGAVMSSCFLAGFEKRREPQPNEKG